MRFSALWGINKKLEAVSERIEILRARVAPSSPRFDAAGGGRQGNQTEALAVALAELTAARGRLEQSYLNSYYEIFQAIGEFPDAFERVFATARYIDCLSWSAIARKYSDPGHPLTEDSVKKTCAACNRAVQWDAPGTGAAGGGRKDYEMRLNGKKIMEIMNSNGTTVEGIAGRTGLCAGSVRWILNNGFSSEEAAERIAEAVGVKIGEILLPDISADMENVIEFVKGDGRATVTFTQGRHKSRIKKLAAQRPGECQVIAENPDGSLCAHIPVAWIRINPSKELSEEQRAKLSERARQGLGKMRVLP